MADCDRNAFPEQYPNGMTKPGMTLRDWFAGMALSGMVARREYYNQPYALLAYQYADAMLKARESESETDQ